MSLLRAQKPIYTCGTFYIYLRYNQIGAFIYHELYASRNKLIIFACKQNWLTLARTHPPYTLGRNAHLTFAIARTP